MSNVKYEEAGVVEGRPVSTSYPLPVQIIAGGGASSPNKTEDAAASSGDTGTAVMGIQTASPADAASAGDYAFLQMKDGRLWVRQLDGLSASATFTPAATSHVGGDCHGAAGTFALSAPSGSVFCITDVSLEIDGATIETTVWTLHLYNVTPPSAVADDGAFDLPSGDRASYLGSISIPQVVDLGATLYIKTSSANLATVKLAGTSLFGYLTNVTTLTPQAAAHIVTITGYPL